MFKYTGANMGCAHKQRSSGSICILLSPSCHCSTRCIPGLVEELGLDWFVAVSFHRAVYNTQRVSHSLQTATATAHTHTCNSYVSPPKDIQHVSSD